VSKQYTAVIRTADELNKLYKDALSSLQLPASWKLEGYNTLRLTTEPDSEIQSVGALFLDTNTRGIEVKRYRLYFHTYTERLGLVEKSVVDFGKFAYKCLVNNRTVEQMNQYLGQ